MGEQARLVNDRVSVVLCTCDGARYMYAQVDSLIDQTIWPDEVIICDDASEDDTLCLLERWSAAAPFQVRLFRNMFRLGVRGNFEQALGRCTGGLIALCDQDDVWLPNKVGALTSAIMHSPHAVAAFSDAAVVDSNLSSLGYSMWRHIGFCQARQRIMREDRPWEVLFKDPVVSGATLMFRSALLPLVLPIPSCWMHDAWIAQIAASQGQLVAVEDPLILYRQHTGNVIGGRKVSVLAQMRRAQGLGRVGLVKRELRRYTALRDRLATFPTTPRRDVMLTMAEAKLEHLSRRAALPTNRLLRGSTVLGEFLNGNYSRFAKDWRNVVADLFMP